MQNSNDKKNGIAIDDIKMPKLQKLSEVVTDLRLQLRKNIKTIGDEEIEEIKEDSMEDVIDNTSEKNRGNSLDIN